MKCPPIRVTAKREAFNDLIERLNGKRLDEEAVANRKGYLDSLTPEQKDAYHRAFYTYNTHSGDIAAATAYLDAHSRVLSAVAPPESARPAGTARKVSEPAIASGAQKGARAGVPEAKAKAADAKIIQTALKGKDPAHAAWQSAARKIDAGDTSAAAVGELITASKALGLSDAAVERIAGLAGEHKPSGPAMVGETELKYDVRPGEDATKSQYLAASALRDTEAAGSNVSSATGNLDARRKPVAPAGEAAGSGARTLASGITRELIREGRADLRGQDVSDGHDIARVGQVFRDPRYETSRRIYVKSGEGDAPANIRAAEGITSRLPGSSASFAGTAKGTPAEETARIKREFAMMQARMKRLGADGYYLLHNHPSGISDPSTADHAVTQSYKDHVPGFLGHVIIDSGEYTIIHPDGTVEKVDFSDKDADKLHQPDIPHDALNTPIKNVTDVALISKQMEVPEGWAVAIHRSSDGKARSIQLVPEALIGRPKEAADWLRGQRRAFGARDTVLYQESPNDVTWAAGSELVKQGAILDFARSDTSAVTQGVKRGKQETAVKGTRVEDAVTLWDPERGHSLAVEKAELDASARTPEQVVVEAEKTGWKAGLGSFKGKLADHPDVDGILDEAFEALGPTGKAGQTWGYGPDGRPGLWPDRLFGTEVEEPKAPFGGGGFLDRIAQEFPEEPESEGPQVEKPAQVPAFIPKNVRQGLADLGYPRAEIDRMKPEDARSALETQTTYKPGVAQKPASTEKPKDATGTKNAVTEKEREIRGLSPVERQAYTGIGEAYLSGRRAVQSGTLDPRALARSISDKPKPLTTEQVGALGYHRTQLMNEHAEALGALANATVAGDQDAIEAQTGRITRVLEDYALNEEALVKGGREQSAAFNARKMIIADDYSLLPITNRLTVAKGEALSAEETAMIKKLVEQENAKSAALQKRLDAAEAQIAKMKARGKVRELDSGMETKGARRPKEKLDAELKSLVGQLANMSGKPVEIPAGVVEESRAPFGDELSIENPKVVKLIKALAKNRVEAGLDTAEKVTDAVHELVKDHLPGVTKREIADVYSGYGHAKQPSKGELGIRLREVKRQQRLINALEDATAGQAPLRSGLQRDQPSPRVLELQRQVKAMMEQNGIKIERTARDPEAQWRTSLQAYKKRLKTETEQIRQNVATGNFAPKVRRPLKLDQEAVNLQGERAEARAELDKMEREFLRANRSIPQKYVDAATSWHRTLLLSGVQTVGKLTGFAVGRAITTPLEMGIAQGLRVVPGIRGFAQKSPLYGGFNPRAEAAAALTLVNRALYGPEESVSRAMWNTIRKGGPGKSLIDLTYGDHRHVDQEFGSFVGRIHGLLKTQAKIAAFQRGWVNLHDFEYKKMVAAGISPEEAQARLAHPDSQMAIGLRAYEFAQRSIMLQDNWAVNSFNGMLAQWRKTGGVPGQAAAAIARFHFPIVKVGTNLVIEGTEYAFGSVKAPAKIAQLMLKHGLGHASEFATEEEADYVMRNFSKGGLGLAVLGMGLLGWFGLQFGGYSRRERKKDDKGPPAGGVQFLGVNLPRWAAHHPVLELGQMAETARQIYHELREKGGSPTSAIIEGGAGAALGLAEEIPFIGEMIRKAHETEGRTWAERMAGGYVKEMTLPPDAPRAARAFDPAESGGVGSGVKRFLGLEQGKVTRKPEGVGEEILAGIPDIPPIGLRARSRVPIARGVPDDIGKEIGEQGKRLATTKRKEGETVEQWQARDKRQKQSIGSEVRDLLTSETYRDADKEEKKRLLSFAIKRARANTDAKTQETDAERELGLTHQATLDRIEGAVKSRSDFKSLTEDERKEVLRGVAGLFSGFHVDKDTREKRSEQDRADMAQRRLERMQQLERDGYFERQVERLIRRAANKAAA